MPIKKSLLNYGPTTHVPVTVAPYRMSDIALDGRGVLCGNEGAAAMGVTVWPCAAPM